MLNIFLDIPEDIRQQKGLHIQGESLFSLLLVLGGPASGDLPAGRVPLVAYRFVVVL